ncbi:MAG: gliding motility lipoprotein GldD [Burkholderiaceae bacterium]|nr:gliding motility lipoprotein GldD [Burkholderiaceae bacterium]
MKRLALSALLILFVTLFASCGDDDDVVYSPKPRGYMRIDFPQKTYTHFAADCPFEFDIPTYSSMLLNTSKNAEPCWYNLHFNSFKATLHLSYKPVNNNLAKYLDDAHEIANKHQIKATGVDEITVVRDSAKVYGLIFDIAGNAASPLQFYLTDSTKHFLRGSLYFNAVPNADSLKIVVDFLKKDVLNMINTTKWK